ncbi:MAG: TolC family protein, partial [Maioricimonas sp. JB049]
MLVLSGCGIPSLRRPLPGPVMPPHYSFNSGIFLWGDASGGPEDAPPEEAMDQLDLEGGVTDPEADADEAGEADADKTDADTADVADADEADVATSRKRFSLPSVRLASFVSRDDDAEPAPLENVPEPGRASADVTPVDEEAEASGDVAATPEDAIARVSFPTPSQSAPGFATVENSAQLSVNSFFADPYLLGLIHQALAGNQELRILAEEINIANNEAYARSGEYRPFVTFGGGAGLEKSSRFSRDGAVEHQLEGAPGRGFPEPLPDFLIATNVSWELDVWHKLRNARDAATMRYLGTRDGRNYIVTRLVAEIAENYYELLALDNILMTLQQTIEIQEQSLAFAESKKAAGQGTELAVQRFQAEVRKNQSELLIIQQRIVEVENRINFLAGRYPQPVERHSVEYMNLHLTTLSAGLPADLLRNRSDIRQAEREMAAAGLDVQVARARFYPSFGLRAGVGLNAFNMRYLLSTPESLIYNVALDMVGPLINRRAIKADYSSANAAQLQSIYHYQKTVLIAYIEVINHLTKVDNYRQSIDAKQQQLEALEASVDVASKLFQNARAEYIEVLLAQRELMEARMTLIETKQQQLQAVVNAYQALGGG